MNVKKGMARSVSFDMTPQTRSGSACRKVGWKIEPDADQRETQADEGKGKGDRVADEEKHHQRHEHDRRHVGDEEVEHLRATRWARDVRDVQARDPQ